MKLYVDGQADATAISITNAQQTLVNANAQMHIGITAGSTSALTNGYLSLFRIGASGITASNAFDLYQDEREMFTDNARVTIDGTNSNVTSIEADDTTDSVIFSSGASINTFNKFLRTSSDTSNVNYYSLPGIYASDENYLYIDTSNGKLYVTLPSIN